jgi:predicted transcriptional regulator
MFLVSAVYNENDIPITRISFDTITINNSRHVMFFESSSLQNVLIKQHVMSVAKFMMKHVKYHKWSKKPPKQL